MAAAVEKIGEFSIVEMGDYLLTNRDTVLLRVTLAIKGGACLVTKRRMAGRALTRISVTMCAEMSPRATITNARPSARIRAVHSFER